MNRSVQIERKTKETVIECTLNLDGQGISQINTGIGFLDHMLNLMTFYGKFDLRLEVKGDLEVDSHHTVEDIGIVIGQCINEIIKDKKGILRYGMCMMPMDECLSRVVVDVSGRSFLYYKVAYNRLDLGTLDLQNIKEFFKAFVQWSAMTLHIENLYGENDHHKVESIFKGLGLALKEALTLVGEEVFSTKGIL